MLKSVKHYSVDYTVYPLEFPNMSPCNTVVPKMCFNRNPEQCIKETVGEIALDSF